MIVPNDINFVLQLKYIMEVEMCLLLIIDDTTSELVCQVRSCDITIYRWQELGKGEGREREREGGGT